MSITKAIMPAAGFGKRYYLSSGAQPKETMPIGTRPVIYYSVRELYESGLSEILIITNRLKSSIEDYFDVSFSHESSFLQREEELLRDLETLVSRVFITYARQRKFQGPANAINEVRAFVKDEPFAVLLPDDLCFYDKTPVTKQLINAFNRCDASIVGMQTMEKEKLRNSFAIEGEKVDERLFRIHSISKFLKTSNPFMGTIGRYILKPSFFKTVKATKPDFNGEYSIAGVLNQLLNEEPVFGQLINGERYDIGNPLEHIKAQIIWALRESGKSDEMLRFLRKVVSNEKYDDRRSKTSSSS